MYINPAFFWTISILAGVGATAIVIVVMTLLWFAFVVKRYKRSATQRIDDVFREYTPNRT